MDRWVAIVVSLTVLLPAARSAAQTEKASGKKAGKKKGPLGATGQTVLDAAQQAGVALEKAPAGAKDVATKLRAAIRSVAETLAARVQSSSLEIGRAADRALAQARENLTPAKLKAQKTKAPGQRKAPKKAKKAKAPGEGKKGIASVVSKLVAASAAEGARLVGEATKTAERTVAEARGVLAPLLSAAQQLGADGKAVVDVVGEFIKAARRQAGRILVAAKRRSSQLVRDTVTAAKDALEGAAGKKKPASKRVMQAETTFVAALNQAVAAQPGAAKGLARQAADKVLEAVGAARNEVITARRLVSGATLDAVRALTRSLVPASLRKTGQVKDKKARSLAFAAAAKKAVAEAQAAEQRMMRAVKASAEKGAAQAGLVVTRAAAAKGRLAAQGDAVMQAAEVFAREIRKESARAMLRAKQAAKAAVKQAAVVAKALIARAAGGKKAKGDKAPKGQRLDAALAGLDPSVRPATQSFLDAIKKVRKAAWGELQAAKLDLKELGKKAIAEVTAKVNALAQHMKDVVQGAPILRRQAVAALTAAAQPLEARVKAATAKARELATQAEALFKTFTTTLGGAPAAKAAWTLGRSKVDPTRTLTARILRSASNGARKAIRAATEEAEKAVDRIARAKRPESSVGRGLAKLGEAVAQSSKAIRGIAKGLVKAFRAHRKEMRDKVYTAISVAAAAEFKLAAEARARFAQIAQHLKPSGTPKGAATTRAPAAAASAMTATQLREAVGYLVTRAGAEAQKLIQSVRAECLRIVASAEASHRQTLEVVRREASEGRTGEVAAKKRAKKGKGAKKDKKDKAGKKAKAGKVTAGDNEARVAIEKAAERLLASFKNRAARTLLLAQKRGQALVRAVLAQARSVLGPLSAKTGLGSVGSTLRARLVGLERLMSRAHAEVETVAQKLLREQRKVAADTKRAATAAATTLGAAGKTASEGIQGLGALRNEPQRLAAAIKGVLDGVRRTAKEAMLEARDKATKLVEAAEGATQAAQTAFAKLKDPVAKVISAWADKLLAGARVDASRLLMTARARAKEMVRRALEDAKQWTQAGGGKRVPAVPAAKSSPGKRA